MKVFVSAAEISSDIHAEKILRSLQKKAIDQGIELEIMGIGGPRLRTIPGFLTIEPAENLRTMGFVEVIRKWSYFKKVIHDLTIKIKEFKPDLILTFDYPDFHFKLVHTLEKKGIAPSSVKICGIPPKVWVWRSKRIEKIRKLYHGVWVIFPFEKKFYEEKGIPVIYEGNPLLEDLPIKNILSVQKRSLETITVMPGSRDSELDSHLPVIPKALELFSQKTGKKITALVPVPDGIELDRLKTQLQDTANVTYEFSKNDSSRCLLETSIGLIKSGTSTLEAAILNCSPVIFYRMNWWSEKIFNLLIRKFSSYMGPVGLPNILLGVKRTEESPFREFLGVFASPENLSDELFRIYSDTQLRQVLSSKSEKIRSSFKLERDGHSSSDRSAGQILKWINHPPKNEGLIQRDQKFAFTVLSILWSAVNFIRRRIYRSGFLPVYEVTTPSILVGNLQAGGAGKTPLIIALAKEAIERGKKVAVISRGYGRTEKNPLGDEPQEIKAALPEVILEVGNDRIAALKKIESQGVDLILFDDGFQNLRFKSKISLLAVTDMKRSEMPFRDFDGEAKYADFVIATKGHQFRKAFNSHPGFFKIDWEWNQQITQPLWLLCGIADPSELVAFYRARGVKFEKIISKKDHSEFEKVEVKKLIEDAKKLGCKLAVTPKDLTKLKEFSHEVLVLRRSIRNQEWINRIFEFTIN
jgi:lipid-A-disaccharide synthase